jgi:cell division protease FtsH
VEYGENQDEVFLGHSVARSQNVSEATSEIIDAEVKRLTQQGFDEARRILTERIEDLHALAKAMLEYETLSGDEIVDILKGIPPKREDESLQRPTLPAAAVPLTHVDSEPEASAQPAPAMQSVAAPDPKAV